MQVAEMKVGDLYPRPRLRLQADGVGVDLSEAVSVVARVRLPGATESVEREVTVADQDVTANFGIVTIVLVAGDTDYRGTIKFDIEVTWATGVQTWPSKGYFKIWLLEDADSAQGGAIPLTSQHDALTLGRLYDVTIDDPEDGQVLQYDDTLGRWVNTAGAPDYSAYFTISRGNVASAEYAGNDIEWRIGAAASQSSVFAMENSEATALTIETLTTDSAVLRAGSALNENLYLFNDRGIAVNVQDNAAALTVKGGAVGSVAVFRGGAVAGNLTTWQDNSSSVLASVSSAGLATFAGLTLSDATNMAFGTTTGTKIGTATSQKLGFYNATPIIRPSGSIITALSNLGLVGSPTLASTALSDTASLAYLASANTFTAGQTVAGSTDTQQLIVKGAVGQTVGLQHWRNSADTTLAYVSAAGYAQFAGISSTANALIDGSTDNIQLRVQGHSVQNANLQTWENSSASVLASVSAAGLGTFAGLASTANITTAAGYVMIDRSGDATHASIYFQRDAGDSNQIIGRTGSSNRWMLRIGNPTAETGTNAGSDLDFLAYQDDGATYAAPLTITRSSGAAKFTSHLATGVPITVKGATSQSANLTEWQDSSAAVLASVSAAGKGTFAGLTVSAGYDINAGHAAADNTRYGVNALRAAATGARNVAIGSQTLSALTSGTDNMALGYSALQSVTTGTANTSVGRNSLSSATAPGSCVALGYYAMANGTGTITGVTAVGRSAGIATTGAYGTFVGSYAGFGATSGANNIYLGSQSGYYSTTQANEFIVNSLDRGNRAGDVASSIIYGVQNATAASQTLTLNAAVTAVYGLSVGDGYNFIIGTTTGSKIGQASSKIGFFNATPVAKPTGVAVDAASIHAALVSLGLISA